MKNHGSPYVPGRHASAARTFIPKEASTAASAHTPPRANGPRPRTYEGSKAIWTGMSSASTTFPSGKYGSLETAQTSVPVWKHSPPHSTLRTTDRDVSRHRPSAARWVLGSADSGATDPPQWTA